MKKISVWLMLIYFFLEVFGCTYSYQSLELDRAVEAEKKNLYKEAIDHYKKVIQSEKRSKISLKAARKAAKISYFEIKDFVQALYFYRHIVLYSDDKTERYSSQKSIANIYFEKLTDYKKAIQIFYRLLVLADSPKDEIEFRKSIAKSYFYLNQFDQSQIEVNQLMTKKIDSETRFELGLFRGNLFFNTKQMLKAIEVFSQLSIDFPKKSIKENVGINIAVCYEELNEFNKAISILDSLKSDYPNPDFIDLKIKRLLQRRKNLPGSGGLRK